MFRAFVTLFVALFATFGPACHVMAQPGGSASSEAQQRSSGAASQPSSYGNPARRGSMAPEGSGIEERLSFDVEVLSDDLLEGRETGQRGHDFAAQFVAERFEILGLRPISFSTEHLQFIPTKRFYQRVDGGVQFFVNGKTFAPWKEIVGKTYQDQVRLAHAPIVFVGWGLQAKALRRDDYRGLDVKGAIVVALKGAPPGLPEDQRAYYTSVQAATAASNGAAAFVSIVLPQEERRTKPFERLARDYLDTPAMLAVRPDGSVINPTKGLLAEAMMSSAAADKLFSAAGRSWSQVLAQAGGRSARRVSGAPLDIKGSMRLGAQAMSGSSPNVIGVLVGTDPVLSRQAVVITAHVDHRGMRTGPSAAGVRKGAVDNAAGVSALLELARSFAKNPPKRSLIFAAVTGHEQGLLGTEYLLDIGFPRGLQPVAGINLDSPLVTFPFVDMAVHGASSTNLMPVVSQVLKRNRVGINRQPVPGQQHVDGSDHQSFVRRRLPSVYLTVGAGGGGKEQYLLFEQRHHGSVSDTYRLIRFDQLARYAALNKQVITAIASMPNKPAWNANDPFGRAARSRTSN